ncbi:MAG TPA: hypothetical protein VFT87_05555 [Candidatus Saccharimonadales bacterium]|nr:hypothetical protein [Candidatus Saccharimonadales bacterium]
MKVFNDHLLVEIKKPEWTTSDDVAFDGKESPDATRGEVVGIPALGDILFFSNYSWILEQSPFNEEMAKKMHTKMSELLGKTVYFERRADVGNTIQKDGKTLATIKLSKIVSYDDV